MNPAIIVLNGELTPPLPSWRYFTSLASHTNCHYRHPLISHWTRYLYIILHAPKRDIAMCQNETTIFQGALHISKVTSLVQTKYWIICIATATLTLWERVLFRLDKCIWPVIQMVARKSGRDTHITSVLEKVRDYNAIFKLQ